MISLDGIDAFESDRFQILMDFRLPENLAVKKIILFKHL
jgi:hypothetical protein